MYVGQIVTVVDHQNGPEEAAIVIRINPPGEPEDYVHLQVFGRHSMYRLNAGPRDETYGVGYKLLAVDQGQFLTMSKLEHFGELVPVGDENATRSYPTTGAGSAPGLVGIDEMAPFDPVAYEAAKGRQIDELANLRNADGSIDTQKAVAEEAAIIEAETGIKATGSFSSGQEDPRKNDLDMDVRIADRKAFHEQIEAEVATRKASAYKANEELEKARGKPKRS